jgi:receptor expression-enhancing protein 1/2/3/4
MPSARAPTTSDFYSLLSGAVAAATSPSTTTTRSPNPTSSTNNNPLIIPPHLTTNADKQTFLTSQREKLAVLIKALDREQRDLDLAYGNSPPGLSKQRDADSERRMRDYPAFPSSPSHDTGSNSGSYEMRKNKSDNSFHNIEREEFEGDSVTGDDDDDEEEKRKQHKNKEERQGAGRRTTSGGSWNPTAWFGGAGGGGGGGAGSRGDDGSGAAKEARRDAAQGISSGVDRPR